MNAIDGTDRKITNTDGPPPSLLTIVLDTNPYAWAQLSSTLPISSMVANLLIFINAHLASGNANEVAVIASHNKRTAWLYPSTAPVTSHHTSNQNGTTSQTQNANKYQPFYEVETNLLGNLDKLLKTTTEEDLSTPTTQIAGALSTALSYINKSTIRHSPVDPTLFESHAILVDDGNLTSSRINLVSRILVLSVSGDLASQYIPVMNAIFAAQRQRIPIDILKLAGDTVLLQQACDATGGIYMAPESPEGLLQYLMMAFLPDATGRKMLVLPSAGSVDFRAACFCHRNVVDIGFVCSVCLSIFCSPNLPHNTCLTCSSVLSLSNALTAAPALIPRKKKKRKRLPGEAATPGGSATPLPGSVTPMHG